MATHTEYPGPVAQFLSAGKLNMFIGGQWTPSESNQYLTTSDPGSGQPIAQFPAGTPKDVDRAVSAAEAAFPQWAAMALPARLGLLRKLADLIDQNASTLSYLETLDCGKPISNTSSFDIPEAAKTIRYYADLMAKQPLTQKLSVEGYEAQVVRGPYGPCAFIFPWNAPLLLVAWGVAPALVAGNTAVIKPAEDTPLTTLFFAQLVQQAGIPAGVVNVVTGTGEIAGAALAKHPRIKRMSFTGSPEIGRLIAEACGRNLVPVKLELGGKGAAIVFEDVDIDKAAESLASAITLNAGQICCTATRWLVHESIMKSFVAKASAHLKSTITGRPLSSETAMGPLINEKQKQRVMSYLAKGQAQGATVLFKDDKADNPSDLFVNPVLLTGSTQNVCAREEIFGPVAFVIPFREEQEAVRVVNESPYGLANSVWSKDLKRAERVARQLVAGNAWINAHNVFSLGIPYGGVNQSGMGGGVLGPETLLDYLRPQSVVRPLPG